MGTRGKFIAAALLLAGLATPIGAQEPSPVRPANTSFKFQRPTAEKDLPARISISADGTTIFLVGQIVPGTFDEFAKSLRAHPKVGTAFLASPGGSVMDGYMIANAVRTRRLVTHVEYMCASVCPVIFAAGRERLLGKNAQLGFHRTYQIDSEGNLAGVVDYSASSAFAKTLADAAQFNIYSPGDDKIVRGLRRAGVSETFLRKVLDAPPQTLWAPAATELLAEGLATRVIDDAAGAPALKLPADHRSLETVSDKLASNIFWQALRTHEPELFSGVAVKYWRAVNSGIGARNVELRERDRIDNLLLDRLVVVPDPLLERFLGYIASLARIERLDDFPVCTPVTNLLLDSANPASVAHRDSSDQLFVDLIENQETIPKMDPKKAKSLLRKNIYRLIQTGLEFESLGETAMTSEQQCRQGMRTMDAIERLEAKHRLLTFRATISLN